MVRPGGAYRRRGVIIGVCLVLLLGCSALPFGLDRAGSREFHYYGMYPVTDPERVSRYEEAWTAVGTCVDLAVAHGVPGRLREGLTLERVEFFTTHRIHGVTEDREYAGTANHDRNHVVIREDYKDDLRVVFHEILHLRVWPQGHGQGLFGACDPLRVPENHP